jgi:PAS domain S-box-containing protein
MLPEQWEQVFEHLGCGVAVLDPADYSLLAVNPAFAQLHGCSEAELVGCPLGELVTPESRSQIPAQVRTALEQGRHVYEATHLRRDGSSFPAETNLTTVRDATGAALYCVASVQDISGRRRAEAAIEASEGRYRDLFENANDVIYTLDLAGRITEINRKGEELTGYSRSELIGAQIDSFVDPADWQPMQAMLARKLSGEPKTTYELRIRTAGGETRALEVSSRLVQKDGGPVAVHGMARDISERRAMEAALRVSRDQLQAIFESVADGVMVQSARGEILYANTAAARLCGYASADALLAASLPEVLQQFTVLDEAGQPLPTNRLPAQRVFHGETAPAAVLRFRARESGAERWTIVQARPAFQHDGRVEFVVSAFQEITAIKQRETAQRFLAEASGILAGSLDYELTLRRVTELAVPLIADWAAVDILDESGTVRQVAVTHTDPERVALLHELRRRYPAEPSAEAGIPGVVRSGRPETHWEISDALLQAAAVNADHLTLLRGLGLDSLLIVPLIARGRTLGALSLACAGSGRRYGPEDLDLALELGRRAALALDTARLYRDVQEALATRDVFLSAVSHDLRTPLATIKGMTQLLLRQARRTESLPSARVAERLDEVDRCANRMVAMIDELLDLVRNEAGKPEIDRRPMNLVELARQVAAEAQRSTHHHRLVVKTDRSEIEGSWDRARLERALANLLSNAIKYSPDGGAISLTLRSVHGPEQGQWAEIAVRDSGLGIPAADLPHIFEPFHRGSNVAGRIQGVGIGLAGVKQIVEQHGGTIAVESTEGNGTCFSLRLPTVAENTEEGCE